MHCGGDGSFGAVHPDPLSDHAGPLPGNGPDPVPLMACGPELSPASTRGPEPAATLRSALAPSPVRGRWCAPRDPSPRRLPLTGELPPFMDDAAPPPPASASAPREASSKARAAATASRTCAANWRTGSPRCGVIASMREMRS